MSTTARPIAIRAEVADGLARQCAVGWPVSVGFEVALSCHRKLKHGGLLKFADGDAVVEEQERVAVNLFARIE